MLIFAIAAINRNSFLKTISTNCKLMGMLDAARNVYSNYFTIRGRATRSEFWWFQLYLWLAYIAIAAVCIAVSLVFELDEGYAFFAVGLFYLFNFIPRFTLLVRRLHDSSKSGWWLLLVLLSGPGIIVLFIFTLLQSEADNKYGPSPWNRETMLDA